MKKEILCKPFPRELIKERAGPHGKKLRYVDVHAVIQRLNEGSDNWSFEVVNHQILDSEVVVLGRLTIDGVTKSAFGGALISFGNDGQPISVGDDLKGAASDALKKSASMFGIGLELYGGKAVTEQFEARPAARPQAEGNVPVLFDDEEQSADELLDKARDTHQDKLRGEPDMLAESPSLLSREPRHTSSTVTTERA